MATRERDCYDKGNNRYRYNSNVVLKNGTPRPAIKNNPKPKKKNYSKFPVPSATSATFLSVDIVPSAFQKYPTTVYFETQKKNKNEFVLNSTPNRFLQTLTYFAFYTRHSPNPERRSRTFSETSEIRDGR